MGIDAYKYSCVDGVTSFLAGAADVLIGDFSILVNQSGVHYEDVQGDVFYIGEHNEIVFNDAIQERVRANWRDFLAPSEFCGDEELINKLDLKFDKLNAAPEEGILRMYEEYVIANRELLINGIDCFCKEMGYYLGKVKAVYHATKESLVTADAKASCYTYIILGIMVIEYDTFILMLVRGSNE